jgi:hypothetical protein
MWRRASWRAYKKLLKKFTGIVRWVRLDGCRRESFATTT